MSKTGQRLIVYTNPAGDDVIYMTAYDDDEAKRQLGLCADKHGRNARVRSVDADAIPPKG